mmetsp:Transcript_112973/g.300117  ORF Transcript_112973/g.300117 Transcript_112973/m.300117 type:complete len:266 (-) Transcript_112973:490-1287(-)
MLLSWSNFGCRVLGTLRVFIAGAPLQVLVWSFRIHTSTSGSGSQPRAGPRPLPLTMRSCILPVDALSIRSEMLSKSAGSAMGNVQPTETKSCPETGGPGRLAAFSLSLSHRDGPSSASSRKSAAFSVSRAPFISGLNQERFGSQHSPRNLRDWIRPPADHTSRRTDCWKRSFGASLTSSITRSSFQRRTSSPHALCKCAAGLSMPRISVASSSILPSLPCCSCSPMYLEHLTALSNTLSSLLLRAARRTDCCVRASSFSLTWTHP